MAGFTYSTGESSASKFFPGVKASLRFLELLGSLPSPRRVQLTFSSTARMSSKPIRRADSWLRSDGEPLSSPARNAAGESKSSNAAVESVVRGLVQSTAPTVGAAIPGAIQSDPARSRKRRLANQSVYPSQPGAGKSLGRSRGSIGRRRPTWRRRSRYGPSRELLRPALRRSVVTAGVRTRSTSARLATQVG